MAEGAPLGDDLATRFIDLKVLSQLPPPHGTIHFHSLLAGTSVQELKARVQDVIPVQSPPASLRFIYQGRALTRDSDTLVDVFGRQAVQQSVTHSLHLVVREAQGSGNFQQPQHINAPRPSGAPLYASAGQLPTTLDQMAERRNNLEEQRDQVVQHTISEMRNVQNQARTPGVLHQTPFDLPSYSSTSQTLPSQQQPQPGSTPQLSQGMPDLNSMFQQHQRQVQQAIAASHQGIAGSLQMPAAPHPASGADGNLHLQSTTPQDHNRENSSVSAGAEYAGLDPTRSSPGETSNEMPEATTTENASSRLTAQAEPVTRHGIGPNGERWMFTTTTSQNQFPSQSGLPPPHFAPQFPQIPRGLLGHHNLANINPFVGFPSGQSLMHRGTNGHVSPYLGWLGPVHAIDYMQMAQQQADSIIQASRLQQDGVRDASRPTSINNATIALTALVVQRNRAQQIINNVLAHGPPAGHTAPTAEQVATLQSLNDQFQNVLQNRVSSHVQTSTSSTGATDPNAGDSLSPAATGLGTNTFRAATGTAVSDLRNNSRTVTAYLVKSPLGTRAILYTPDGVFSNNSIPRFSDDSRVGSEAERHHAQRSLLNGPDENPRPEGGRMDRIENNRQFLLDQAQGNPILQPLAQQVLQEQQQQQQRPGPNAIAMNLTPFFQALWLFVRGYAFMWFFLGGRGAGSGMFSWRSILLFALSFAYWAVQAGIGAEQIAIVRRYWNELVGLGPEARQAPRAQNVGRDQPPGDVANNTHGAARQGIDATEQRPAARNENGEGNQLLGGQGGPLREWLRPFERTIALFLASLYPGVGERHVAERERARREAEERDRARAAAAAAAAATAAQEPQAQVQD